MKKLLRSVLLSHLLFVASPILAEDEIAQYDPQPCFDPYPPGRGRQVPVESVGCVTDEYLTGYIQALIDMHYYEFQVRILVVDRQVYVFNLPRNELLAHSILCFIVDVPCIEGVQRIDCCPDDYLMALNESDPQRVNDIVCSSAYQAMCDMPGPCARVRGIWFPQTTVLFAPLVADPRQVTNAAALRFNDSIIGKHVGAVTFGDDFSIYRWLDVWWWHGDLQFDIEAGIFAVFDLDHPEACLVNTDFFVAPMLTYAFDWWSFRFRIWHLSSHLGDEFLLSNPGFDRRNLSDEGVDFFASYQWNPAIRLYAGLGYIFDRDKEFPEQPFYAEGGAEIRVFGWKNHYDRLYTQPFLAMHFRSWQEHDYDIDQTYALGVEWSKIQGVGRKFRIFVEYHDGFCKEGQFVRERSSYVAFKTEFGF